MPLEGEFLRLVIGGQTQMTPPAAGEPGIKLFSGDENFRFGLVVDVEKRMHDCDKVNIKKKALRSILRVSGIKSGIFYTKVRNEVEVFTTEGSLGLVAFRAEAQISLTKQRHLTKNMTKKPGGGYRWLICHAIRMSPTKLRSKTPARATPHIETAYKPMSSAFITTCSNIKILANESF